LGIIGFGKIGQATAKIALGIGIEGAIPDVEVASKTLTLSFFDEQSLSFTLQNSPKERGF